MSIPRRTLTRDETGGAAVHDIGGLDFGPIDRHEHDLALWEKRVDAMMILMYARKGAFKVDAMRRVIEDYGRQAYDATDYYEKWVRALRNLCVEQEILSREEVEKRVAEVEKRLAKDGRGASGERVPWDGAARP